ncbi:hypothetical protein BH11MYX1_BH11MYX1_31010 [soil metagenome]
MHGYAWLVWLILCAAPAARAADTAVGRELYAANCASCHGDDGRGGAARDAGYPVAMPDFTDCELSTPEANSGWLATAHMGGHARGFDRRMPAFDRVLGAEELSAIVWHLRTFCTDDRWPRGELNLPRPFLTEKAFPEDEFAVTAAATRTSITTTMQYERRLGARYQLEVTAPVLYSEQPTGGWAGGIGDLAFGLKRVLISSLETGSILTAQLELQAPTGRTDRGFGNGTTMVEGSVLYAQILPAGGFLHAQLAYGAAYDRTHPDEVFVRGAIGDAIVPVSFGRLIASMLEVMASRELVGSVIDVDLVPQVQVTLSARQHIRAAVGVQGPVTDRTDRATAGLVYLLWDWADGTLVEGW